MLRPALLLAGMLSISTAALAQDTRPQVWLNAGMLSHHFKDSEKYRDENYGFGIEVFLRPEHGVLAGTFINSNDERSRYAGYHWRPWQQERAALRISGGLVFALIDGYSNTRDGRTFPVVLPTVSAEFGYLGAHLIFVPHPKNASALALQLRLRVW
jgi:hypothetical protein